MRRRLLSLPAALAAALAVFVAAPALDGGHHTASAHPLGNFTVNRYARIELEAGKVHLRYVIDMAEIPAFQELQAIDQDHDSAVSDAEGQAYLSKRLPELAKNLDLRINDARVALTPDSRSLTFPEGQGGLRTLRLVADYQGVMPAGWESGVRAAFKDGNYSDRIGWKEIVVRGGQGVALSESSVATEDQSAELTAYPESLLKSPLDVREARFAFVAGVSDAAPKPIAAPAAGKTVSARGKTLTGFAKLIERQKLTPAFVALSLLAAMAWGAAHALGPGHGKTIVGAYLVGSRGTARHALALGLTVTATHTSSVIALGLVTLYASRFIATEDLYLWLSVASGALVVAMGVSLFWSRLRAVRRAGWATALADGHSHEGGERHEHGPEEDDHHHHHDREPEDLGTFEAGPESIARQVRRPAGSAEHPHGHSHLPTATGWRGLVMLGISGGLLPCPTALVVMLGAIALDRVAYGMVLIVAFSVGLAGVLTGIGILLVYAGRVMSRPRPAGAGGGLPGLAARLAVPGRLLEAVPLLSALIILAVGVVLTGQALAAL